MSYRRPEQQYRESVEPDPEIQAEKKEKATRIVEEHKKEFLERVDEDQEEKEEAAN